MRWRGVEGGKQKEGRGRVRYRGREREEAFGGETERERERGRGREREREKEGERVGEREGEREGRARDRQWEKGMVLRRTARRVRVNKSRKQLQSKTDIGQIKRILRDKNETEISFVSINTWAKQRGWLGDGGNQKATEIVGMQSAWECEHVKTLLRQKAGSQSVKLISEQKTEVIEGRPN